MEGYKIYLLILLTIIVLAILITAGLGIKVFISMDKITEKAKKTIKKIEERENDNIKGGEL